MRKLFTIVATILVISTAFTCFIGNANAQSPDWLWAKSMGGVPGDVSSAQSSALDDSGNVYTTGFFHGTIDFDPGPGLFNLPSMGGGYTGMFISKLDSSGNLVWVKQIAGSEGGAGGYSIVLDASGNIYTTGSFIGTVDFNPGVETFNLTSTGGIYGWSDIFVSKLNSSGNFVWAKAMGGTEEAFGASIAIDGSGNVYTTGYFYDTCDFDPGIGTYNLISNGYIDIFISKLDSSGNFVWAKTMGGTGNDISRSLVLDSSDNVYTTGYFYGTVDFDPGVGTFSLKSAGGSDIYISKLDGSGNFVWAKAIGGSGYDYGLDIALDASANVYTSGSFQDTTDFDPGAGTFNLTSNVGKYSLSDVFVSKLNSSGDFVWAKAMGGINLEQGTSIAVDDAGNILTAGLYYESEADFDPGEGSFTLTPYGSGDIFISKLDNSGNFVWATSVGGSNDDEVLTIVLDTSGNVYISGYFWSPSITFGSDILSNTNSGREIFVAKLNTALAETESLESNKRNSNVSVYPNPATNQLTVALGSINKKVEITITDITGKTIYTNIAKEIQRIEINTKHFAPGVYVLRIQTSGKIETKRLVIAK